MNKKDLDYFKKKLETEKGLLEEELKTVGRKSPQHAGGWEATSGTMEIDNADENEVADKIEEFDGNTSILDQLERQMGEVQAALDRITAGTYGICEVSGEPIEKERLEANPSARTSLKHMKA
jgi:RNA polymerase-binding transcription factor DksA